MTGPEMLRFNLETARRALGQAENLLADPEVVASADGDREIGGLVEGIMVSVELVARNAHVGDPPRWAEPATAVIPPESPEPGAA